MGVPARRYKVAEVGKLDQSSQKRAFSAGNGACGRGLDPIRFPQGCLIG